MKVATLKSLTISKSFKFKMSKFISLIFEIDIRFPPSHFTTKDFLNLGENLSTIGPITINVKIDQKTIAK